MRDFFCFPKFAFITDIVFPPYLPLLNHVSEDWDSSPCPTYGDGIFGSYSTGDKKRRNAGHLLGPAPPASGRAAFASRRPGPRGCPSVAGECGSPSGPAHPGRAQRRGPPGVFRFPAKCTCLGPVLLPLPGCPREPERRGTFTGEFYTEDMSTLSRSGHNRDWFSKGGEKSCQERTLAAFKDRSKLFKIAIGASLGGPPAVRC